MTLHTLIVVSVGTYGILLLMGGFVAVLRPRRLWQRSFAIERRWREQRLGAGWTQVERRIERRGYFWIPAHVELRTPNDIYAYALSDTFWRSPYAWFVRALFWYAGALLVFFGLLILGMGLPSLP